MRRGFGLALALVSFALPSAAFAKGKVYITADVEGSPASSPASSWVLAYLPVVERVDAHTVRFRGKDMPEVARFIEFVLDYEPGLAQ